MCAGGGAGVRGTTAIAKPAWKSGRIRKGWVRRYFRVEGASYALVEHQHPGVKSYIAERLFVFPYSPKFSVRHILGELREYRKEFPPNIKLLSTTPKEQKSKK